MLRLPMKYMRVAFSLHAKSLNTHLQYQLDMITGGISTIVPMRLHIVRTMMNMFNGMRSCLFLMNIIIRIVFEMKASTNMMSR